MKKLCWIAAFLALLVYVGCELPDSALDNGASDHGGPVVGSGTGAPISCDSGYGPARDNSTCLPRGACTEHAHVESDGCVCDYGYALSNGGSACEPDFDCGEHASLQGSVCVCESLYQLGVDQTVCVPEGLQVEPADGPLNIAESTVAISNDSNSDGALNPGETGTISFALTNTGTVKVNSPLSALFRSDNPDVSWSLYRASDCARDPVELSFFGCAPGDVCELGPPYSVTVCLAAHVPVGTRLSFHLDEVQAGLQQITTGLRFSLPVQAAGGRLAIAPDRKISNDSNGDGALNPGETAQLSFDLQNVGTAKVNSPLSALFRSDNPDVSWSLYRASDCARDPIELSFFGCAPGDVCELGPPYSVTVCLAADAKAGKSLEFNVFRVVDGLGQTYPELVVSMPVYRADSALAIADDVAVGETDGDGDGTLEAGETGALSFALTNTGTAKVNSPLSALFRSDNPDVSWSLYRASDCARDPIELSFFGCAPGDACELAPPYSVTVCLGETAAVPVDFRVTDIEDGLGQSYPDLTFSLPVE